MDVTKKQRALTKKERAAFDRIREEMREIESPDDKIRHLLVTYAGTPASSFMSPPNYDTILLGAKATAMLTAASIDQEIKRRDVPGLRYAPSHLVIPSQRADGESFLEQRTKREFVVIANGEQTFEDRRQYIFMAVDRAVLRR